MAPESLNLLASLAGLHPIPWRDPDRANRMLGRILERAPASAVAPLLDRLEELLPEAADPEMALVNLDRWAAQLATPASTFALLAGDPRLLADLLGIFGASQYLADILVRDAGFYSLLLESAGARTAEEYFAAVEAALRPLKRPESRRDALRRVKRREFLRIGWRDLARRAPFAEIIREISDLADALIAGALRLAREEVDARFTTASAAVRFAVIGMGKLGARELNYSSDVDLLFVMDSPDPLDDVHRRYATRLAERLIAILAEETGEGRCFRVDMRLRPEGRSGALVRSFAAFRTYYDRWAETWERQALIKARPVAGNPELGKRFAALVRPVVYRRFQGATLLDDVREMRQARERELSAAGHLDLHVKEGRGTIRDVEFTLQLLQLLFGADVPALQVADTLTTLERMEQAELLAPDERQVFQAGYQFFREVEHRLQLLHDLPVRLAPTDPDELRRLARSMGFPEGEPFMAAFRRHREAVRNLAEAIHARLGAVGSEDRDTLRPALLAADTPEGAAVLRLELEARGFPAPESALKALARLATGSPHYPHPAPTRRLFADLAPTLLAECAAAADPTLALEGLAEFADRKLLHRALYQTLLEAPEALRNLCRFAGAAPAALKVVLRYPELSDLVTDGEQLSRPRTLGQLHEELAERLTGISDFGRRLSVLRRYKLREFVRLAARHVVGPPTAADPAEGWADQADALLRAGLRIAVDRLQAQNRWPFADGAGFAVLALGRYGGRTLHFASDLDLLYVFDPAGGGTQQQYDLLAKTLGEVLQTVTEEGKLFEVDLRLRPEGRQGVTVASLEAARRYYGEGGRAQTWEFQMLTRLRPVAGSAEVAARFQTLLLPRLYRDPVPAAWRAEIREMKRRMEQERVSEAVRYRHLKLGPGGLSDIEFLVQYLQLAHGAAHPEVRHPSTPVAVRALAAHGVLEPAEADQLEAAFHWLNRLRQTLYLFLGDRMDDLLPTPESDPRRAWAVAQAMGSTAPEELRAEFQRQTTRVRAMFQRVLG